MPKTINPALAALAVSLMALALAACGQGGGTTQPAAPTAVASSKAAASTAISPVATSAPTTGGSAASGGCNYNAKVAGPFAGEANALTGAGATFPQPLYTRWFSDYNKLTNVKVNYQGVGSGAGIKQITEKTVDFGASDAPMTDAQLKAAPDILHIPTAMGAVVVTYNLANVTQPLNLSGETVGGIYLGDIRKWNDPKIVAENPDVTLPDQNIVAIRRSDGSGTTNAFTSWLAAANPAWKEKVGAGTTVNWPTGLGAQGNAGVAGEVKNNPGSISYVEQIYAEQNKMAMANIKNKAGKFVKPSLEGVTAAAANSAKTIPPDLRFTIINAEGDAAYPISTPTWLLAHQNQTDAPKAQAVTRAMWWGLTDGQKVATELGYAALPPELVKLALNKVCSIQVNGAQAFPGK